jgi:hypothetical protein
MTLRSERAGDQVFFKLSDGLSDQHHSSVEIARSEGLTCQDRWRQTWKDRRRAIVSGSNDHDGPEEWRLTLRRCNGRSW